VAVRFFIVPRVGSGTTLTDTFRPAYFGQVATFPQLAGVLYQAMDYGLDPTFLVGADVTQAQHDFLSVQSDVFALPLLDTTVGGNPTLNQIRNRLEQRSIPGSWLVAGTTYRQIVGRVGRTCQILQRMHGRHNQRLFEAGVTLDSLLTSTLLTTLVDIGTSFGMTTSGLSTAITVRQALLVLADQFPQIHLAGEVF
jgi:hypothetical protein